MVVVLPAGMRLKILSIDDEPFVREFVSMTLTRAGYLIETATNGNEGVRLFRDALACGAAFNLVITDLAMPDGDGAEVTAAVKAESPGTPVILLTAWGWAMEEGRDVPGGVDLVIDKPVRREHLCDAVSRLLATSTVGISSAF